MTPTFKLQPSETPARTTEFIAEMPMSRANRERRWILRNLERGPIMIRKGRRAYMVAMPHWMYTRYAEAAAKMAAADPQWEKRLAPLRELGPPPCGRQPSTP